MQAIITTTWSRGKVKITVLYYDDAEIAYSERLLWCDKQKSAGKISNYQVDWVSINKSEKSYV
jgi:hypothetical protein